MSLPTYKGDIQALFWRPCHLCECRKLDVLRPITECLSCGHEEVQHKEMEELLPGVLKKLVLLGKSNADIRSYLQMQNIHWSVRTLKRRLNTLGIRRNEDVDPECLLNVVEKAQERSNHRAGYRQLHRMIRQELNLSVKRTEVQLVARALDPDGPRERLSRRCKKRVFECPGPDQLWSIDGHDKLATFGIYIHGCVDAFSRKVLWCHTYSTNHNPRFVARYFLDTVQERQVVPRRIRSDPGSENTVVAEVQMYLRRNGIDEDAGPESVMVYKSKFNQKIECFWSGMYNKVTSVLQTKFRVMSRRRLILDPRYREAFLYVFLPLVKGDVDDYVSWWNNHKIRKQSGVAIPTGDSPDNIYYMPHKFEAERYGCPFYTEDLEISANTHNIPDELPDIVSAEFRSRADTLLERNGLVPSKDSGETVFEALCTLN